MRKAITLIVALLVCLSMTCAAFADEFVPSISYKGAPEIVNIEDAEGNDAIGVIRDASGNVVSYVYEECLVITSVAEAETSTKISAEAKDTLLAVYAALTDGSMNLPYGSNVDAASMVIKDLFDLSLVCTTHGHAEELAKEGVVLELTFDVSAAKDNSVVVMTFGEEWSEIAKTVNNGDGTVTCTFEHLCPVSISVGSPASNPPGKTGDEMGRFLILWAGLMVVSAAALVTLVVVRRKAKQ